MIKKKRPVGKTGLTKRFTKNIIHCNSSKCKSDHSQEPRNGTRSRALYPGRQLSPPLFALFPDAFQALNKR